MKYKCPKCGEEKGLHYFLENYHLTHIEDDTPDCYMLGTFLWLDVSKNGKVSCEKCGFRGHKNIFRAEYEEYHRLRLEIQAKYDQSVDTEIQALNHKRYNQ